MAEEKERQKVLLVDDDPLDRNRMASMLRERDYDVIEADGGTGALRVLGQPAAPRLAVVDWNMSSINGPELCRILRSRSPYTYVVLTTAREGRKPLIEAMHSGADGYLQKPIAPEELEAWLVAGKRIVDMQDQLLRQQAELERRATHDYLTGIYNRRAVIEELNREMQRGVRMNTPASVVLFDIDHFKSINDEFGHAIGDEVLVQFAERFVKATRGYDVFGRYGGEEFLFIVPGEKGRTALRVAQRLLGTVTGPKFKTAACELEVRASAGVASTDQGYQTPEALISAADQALYRAKREGRSCCRLARHESRPEPARRSG